MLLCWFKSISIVQSNTINFYKRISGTTIHSQYQVIPQHAVGSLLHCNIFLNFVTGNIPLNLYKPNNRSQPDRLGLEIEDVEVTRFVGGGSGTRRTHEDSSAFPWML